jgi:hypothetical protein
MADFNFNLTPNIKQNTLGDMVNMASGIQSFQQAQQMNPLALEKAQIENQVLKQKNQERLGLQDFMSNPDNWQTNGRIDMDKINKVIPKIAPLTGTEVINSLSGLHKSQTEATQAKQGLNQSQRQRIAEIDNSLGMAGVNDPNQVIKAYQSFIKRSPEDTDIHRLLNAKIDLLKQAKPGTHITDDLLAESAATLPVSEQLSTFGQKATQQSLGGAVGEVLQTPRGIKGEAPSAKFTGNQEPTVLGPSIVEISNVKYYATPSKVKGGLPTLTPVGSEEAPKQTTQQTTQQTQAPKTQQRASLIVEDMPVPAGGIPQLNDFQKQRYESGTKLIKDSVDAASAAKEGEETSRQVKNYMGAAAGSAPGQMLRKAGQWVAGDPQLEILTKNLADQQLRNMQIMGAKTDAASADVKAASGKADLTREGLQAIVDRTDASNTAVAAFQKGLKRYTDQGLNGIVHADKFKQAWADNYDVRIFKAMNIERSNMPKAKKDLERQKLLKGLSDKELKDLRDMADNIERLENGGR